MHALQLTIRPPEPRFRQISHTCSSNDILTAEKREYLKSVLLAGAKTWFEERLSVNPVSGSLVVPFFTQSSCDAANVGYACCEQFQSSLGGAKSNTDVVIYVTARPTATGTIAWALTCMRDSFQRPVSGHANFGPTNLDTSTRKRAAQLGVAVHEVTHALGFSASQYTFYRFPGNGARRGQENVVGVTTERGREVRKIITPEVRAAARRGCGGASWP